MNSKMNTSTKHNNLTAVVSFEGSLEKLYSCLQALDTWIMQIIVVLPENEAIEKQITSKFNVRLCHQKSSTTKVKWESGLNQTNTLWVLLIRSNEIVTGQLRQAITDKIKTSGGETYKYLLPLTMIFLKKRLKYPLDWDNSQASLLAHTSKVINDVSQQGKHETLGGELVRYGEDTISECSHSVIQKAEERAANLAQHRTHFSTTSLFLRALITSIKVFIRIYILKKGFKEGFEGITFAICNAHAELLGYLRYYELYVRGGKLLYDNLSSLNNILIIKLRDIGDNILCTPLIRNLKQHLPNVSVSVLTWSYSIPVFEKNPHIDNFYTLPKNPSSKNIINLQNELNNINFDLIMSTHSGGLSSKILSKIKSPNKINNFYRGCNKFYTVLTKESDYYRSSIERDLDCLRSLGLEAKNTHTEIFLTSHEITWARNTMEARGIDFTKKIALIHPTAAVSIREWPLEKFKHVIKNFNNKTTIQPIVVCTELEYPKVKVLLDDIPDLVVFKKITVRQMMAIIHECDLVIDNDSSPSHVAAAFGIPTIVLFSQAIKKIFRPYDPEKQQHFIFYNDVNCRECELTECSDRICLDFSSDEVYAQALEILSLKKKES
jgi:ADP-heptose:LPS heptosyltransferase